MKGNIAFKVKDISLEEQEKYADNHVAIINGKVVGWGGTVKEAFKMAKEKFPGVKSEEILLRYIPKEELLVL